MWRCFSPYYWYEYMTTPREINETVSQSLISGEAGGVVVSPLGISEDEVKGETLSVEDEVQSAKETTEMETTFHETVLAMLGDSVRYNKAIFESLVFEEQDKEGKVQRRRWLPKVSKDVQTSITTEAHKLKQELSTVKEHLSNVQSQSQQIDNQIREIADAKKEKLCDLEKVFKENFAKIVWECLFSIEEYSNDDAIGKIGNDEAGCEKLKEIVRNVKDDIKIMLEQDFGTRTFEDPTETTELNTQRHKVNRGLWEQTDEPKKHRHISRTFCYGVEDLEGNIIFPQRVAAYDYKTPENHPEQPQTNNPSN